MLNLNIALIEKFMTTSLTKSLGSHQSAKHRNEGLIIHLYPEKFL